MKIILRRYEDNEYVSPNDDINVIVILTLIFYYELFLYISLSLQSVSSGTLNGNFTFEIALFYDISLSVNIRVAQQSFGNPPS